MTKMVDNAGRIVRAVGIPLIADSGYGNPINVVWTVHNYRENPHGRNTRLARSYRPLHRKGCARPSNATATTTIGPSLHELSASIL